MVHRVCAFVTATVVAGSLLVAGCSSGTEPQQPPPVEFAVSITTTPSRVTVGDTVYATFTIENVTSARHTRHFASLYYPRVFVANGSNNLRDLLIFGYGIRDYHPDACAARIGLRLVHPLRVCGGDRRHDGVSACGRVDGRRRGLHRRLDRHSRALIGTSTEIREQSLTAKGR